MPESSLVSADLTPERLDRRLEGYTVVRQVGHGAMGIVFEAKQSGVGRHVAVKVLPPAMTLRDRTVKRFLREAEAMGRLAHPNIADVYEVGSVEALHFFTMQFVEGPPLDVVLKAGPLATSDVIQIGIDVANALAHAHSRGVLHRDVKPANLLRDGEHVVLTDFGLARPIDSEDAGTMTESGDLVGTPLYMSPEQIAGDVNGVDGRTDIWGLGATLYELLAQRPPFPGSNAQAILNGILHKEPPKLRRVRDDVPRDLEAVLFKCLEKDVGKRYANAAALVTDLEAVRDGRQVTARKPRFFDPFVRWIRKHPMEASVAAVTLVLIGVLTLILRLSSQELRDRQTALDQTQGELLTAQTGQETERAARTVESARYELLRADADWERARRSVLQAEIEMDATRATMEQARREFQEATGLLGLRAQASAQRRQKAAEAKLARLEDQASAWEREQQQAEQRVEYLLEAFNDMPAILIEIYAIVARWRHEEGRDNVIFTLIEDMGTEVDDPEVMAVQAAMYAGLGRFEEALALHRRRVVLMPRDPEPLLDLARTLHEQAEEAQLELEFARAGNLLRQELPLLQQAESYAPFAQNGAAVLVATYIERGRVLIQLDQPRAAAVYLDMALEHDASRAEAKALLRAAGSGTDSLAAAAPEPITTEPVAEGPTTTPLPNILPTALGPEDAIKNLESAGRNLQSLYRGVRGLLNVGAKEQAGAGDAAGGD